MTYHYKAGVLVPFIKKFQKQLIIAVAAMFIASMAAMTLNARAATTVVVAPTDTQGWTIASTRTNGFVSFVNEPMAPVGSGALSLVTTDTTATFQDKAQFMKPALISIQDLNDLSYWTKQISASFASGLPSYQLETCLYGVTSTGCVPSPTPGGSGFSTFVYEPYVVNGNSAVQNGVWQNWDVDSGVFWSTRSEKSVISSQGQFTYNLDYLKAEFPNAVIVRYGVNVGSNNPNYNTLVDGFVFNETLYDFEVALPPVVLSSKEECKDGGWRTSELPVFKNQGQCVSHFASNAKSTNARNR